MKFSVGHVDSHVQVRGGAKEANANKESSVDEAEVREVVRRVLEEERLRRRRQEAFR